MLFTKLVKLNVQVFLTKSYVFTPDYIYDRPTLVFPGIFIALVPIKSDIVLGAFQKSRTNNLAQRRAKTHSSQAKLAKLDRLKLFSRLGLKPQAIICRP